MAPYKPGNSDESLLAGLFDNIKFKFNNIGPTLLAAAFAGLALFGGKESKAVKGSLDNDSVSNHLMNDAYVDFANKTNAVYKNLFNKKLPERVDLEKYQKEITEGNYNGGVFLLTQAFDKAGIPNAFNGAKTVPELLAAVGDAKKPNGANNYGVGDAFFVTNKNGKLDLYTVDEVNGDKIKLTFVSPKRKGGIVPVPVPEVEQQVEFTHSVKDGASVFTSGKTVVTQATDTIDLEKHTQNIAPEKYKAKKEELESKHGTKKIDKEKSPEELITSSKNKEERSVMTETVDIRNLGSALNESGAKRNSGSDEIIKKSLLETDYLSLKDIENKKAVKSV